MKIHWTTNNTYVDTDTGELITKKLIDEKIYRIITITKKIQIYDETHRIIKYTKLCRKNEYKQQTIL